MSQSNHTVVFEGRPQSLVRALDTLQGSFDDFARAQGHAGKVAGEQRKALRKQYREYRRTSRQVVGLTRRYDPYARALLDVSRAQSTLNRALASGLITQREHNRLLRSARQEATAAVGPTLALGRAVAGLGAGYAAARGVRDAIDEWSAFGAQMAKVGAVASASDEELAQLAQNAREVGLDSAGFDATAAASGQEALVRAGLDVRETMAVVADALDLAQGEGIKLASAADLAAQSLRIFELDANQSQRVVDVLARSTRTSNQDINHLAASLVKAAPAGARFGLTIEEVSALLSTLAQKGQRGADAGTAIRSILAALADLQNASPRARDALSRVGLSVDDLDVRTKGLLGVLQTLNGVDFDDTFALVGREAGTQLGILVDEVDDVLARVADLQTSAVGVARSGAVAMGDNLRGDALALASGVSELRLILGETADGAMRSFVQRLDEMARSDDAREAAAWLGAQLRTVAEMLEAAADVAARYGDDVARGIILPLSVTAQAFAEVARHVGPVVTRVLDAAEAAGVLEGAVAALVALKLAGWAQSAGGALVQLVTLTAAGSPAFAAFAGRLSAAGTAAATMSPHVAGLAAMVTTLRTALVAVLPHLAAIGAAGLAVSAVLDRVNANLDAGIAELVAPSEAMRRMREETAMLLEIGDADALQTALRETAEAIAAQDAQLAEARKRVEQHEHALNNLSQAEIEYAQRTRQASPHVVALNGALRDAKAEVALTTRAKAELEQRSTALSDRLKALRKPVEALEKPLKVVGELTQRLQDEMSALARRSQLEERLAALGLDAKDTQRALSLIGDARIASPAQLAEVAALAQGLSSVARDHEIRVRIDGQRQAVAELEVMAQAIAKAASEAGEMQRAQALYSGGLLQVRTEADAASEAAERMAEVFERVRGLGPVDARSLQAVQALIDKERALRSELEAIQILSQGRTTFGPYGVQVLVPDESLEPIEIEADVDTDTLSDDYAWMEARNAAVADSFGDALSAALREAANGGGDVLGAMIDRLRSSLFGALDEFLRAWVRQQFTVQVTGAGGAAGGAGGAAGQLGLLTRAWQGISGLLGRAFEGSMFFSGSAVTGGSTFAGLSTFATGLAATAGVLFATQQLIARNNARRRDGPKLRAGGDVDRLSIDGSAALDDAGDAFEQAVLGLVTSIGGTVSAAIPEMEIQARRDREYWRVRVREHGTATFLASFESLEEALQFAAVEALRRGDMTGVGPNVAAALKSADVGDVDSLRAALDLAKALDTAQQRMTAAGRAGLEVAAAMDAIIGAERQTLQAVEALGLVRADALTLTHTEISAQREQLQAQIEGALGVRSNIRALTALTEQVRAYNSGLDDLAATRARRLEAVQAEIAALRDAGVQAVATVDDVAALRDVVADVGSAGRRAVDDVETLGGALGAVGATATDDARRLRDLIKEEEALLAVREQMPDALDLSRVHDAMRMEGANLTEQLVSMLRVVHGAQFGAAELQRVQTDMFILQLALLVEQVDKATAATGGLALVSDALMTRARDTVAALQAGDITVPVQRSTPRISAPRAARRDADDSARERLAREIEATRRAFEGDRDALRQAREEITRIHETYAEAARLQVPEASVHRLRELQLGVRALADDAREIRQADGEIGVETDLRRLREQYAGQFDALYAYAAEIAAQTGETIEAVFRPIKDDLDTAFSIESGNRLRDEIDQLRDAGDLDGLRALQDMLAGLAAVDMPPGVADALAAAAESLPSIGDAIASVLGDRQTEADARLADFVASARDTATPLASIDEEMQQLEDALRAAYDGVGDASDALASRLQDLAAAGDARRYGAGLDFLGEVQRAIGEYGQELPGVAAAQRALQFAMIRTQAAAFEAAGVFQLMAERAAALGIEATTYEDVLAALDAAEQAAADAGDGVQAVAQAVADRPLRDLTEALDTLRDDLNAFYRDGQLATLTDPFSRQLDELQDRFDDLRERAIAQGLIDELPRLTQSLMQQAAAIRRQAAQPARQLLDELVLDDPRRGAGPALADLRARFVDAAAAARTDPGAIAGMVQLARQLRDAAAGQFDTSSGAYLAIDGQIRAALQQVPGVLDGGDPVVSAVEIGNDLLRQQIALMQQQAGNINAVDVYGALFPSPYGSSPSAPIGPTIASAPVPNPVGLPPSIASALQALPRPSGPLPTSAVASDRVVVVQVPARPAPTPSPTVGLADRADEVRAMRDSTTALRELVDILRRQDTQLTRGGR
ncbi:MAG: phage tail tape measure protein [Acidobacteriota bacterium]